MARSRWGLDARLKAPVCSGGASSRRSFMSQSVTIPLSKHAARIRPSGLKATESVMSPPRYGLPTAPLSAPKASRRPFGLKETVSTGVPMPRIRRSCRRLRTSHTTAAPAGPTFAAAASSRPFGLKAIARTHELWTRYKQKSCGSPPTPNQLDRARGSSPPSPGGNSIESCDGLERATGDALQGRRRVRQSCAAGPRSASRASRTSAR
jgi:hypothetical protein